MKLFLPLITLLAMNAHGSSFFLSTHLEDGDNFGVWFGHTALIYEDSDADRPTAKARVLQFYGVPSKVKDPLSAVTSYFEGKLKARIGQTSYRSYHRSRLKQFKAKKISIDKFELTKEQVSKLKLEMNTKLKQRSYFYHAFDNNCATNVLSLLSSALKLPNLKSLYKKSRFEILEETLTHAITHSQNKKLQLSSTPLPPLALAALNSIVPEVKLDTYTKARDFTDEGLLLVEHLEKGSFDAYLRFIDSKGSISKGAKKDYTEKALKKTYSVKQSLWTPRELRGYLTREKIIAPL